MTILTTRRALVPTQEQGAVVDGVRSGISLKVYAGAGSGKTTTLELCASVVPSSVYVVFNRSNAVEARERMPATCQVATAHSLAFHDVGYAYKARLTPSIWAIKRALIARGGSRLYKIADDALATFTTFLASADRDVTAAHAPPKAAMPERCAQVAAQLWKWASDPGDEFPVTHDVYLKLWQLRGVQIPRGTTFLVDEFQDLNPVMISIAESVRRTNQTICVGDPYQQIYAWRGAVNALESIDLPMFALTQSWRFGQAVADVANAILATRFAPFRIKGMATSTVGIGDAGGATGIIARTNVGLVEAALLAAQNGKRIHVFGGVDELADTLLAAFELYKGRDPKKDPFAAFASWNDLAEAVEESPAAAELRPIVKLIGMYKDCMPEVCEELRRAQTAHTHDADLIFGTSHKFKGQQTKRLAVCDDYRPYAGYRQNQHRYVFDTEAANVMYVTVTRAMEHLSMSPAFANALATSLRDADCYWMQQARRVEESGAIIFSRVLEAMSDANLGAA